MSKYSSDSGHSGLGIWDVLLIVFIVLKLIGVINWGWRWVLAPLWISVLIALVVFSSHGMQTKRKGLAKASPFLYPKEVVL